MGAPTPRCRALRALGADRVPYGALRALGGRVCAGETPAVQRRGGAALRACDSMLAAVPTAAAVGVRAGAAAGAAVCCR